MSYYKSIYLFVYFLFSCTSLHTANHYVDKNAKGYNNGTSWEDAWESFSDIEWGQIQPGDILYISGGTDSTIYYESLAPTVNGTADNLITIRNGLDPKHKGKVILVGNGHASGTAMPLSGRSYLRIVGISMRSWNSGMVTGNSNVIYWDSCNVNDTRWSCSPAQNGSPSDSIFIWNCRLICDYTTHDQTDVLSGTGVTNLEVKNCYIYQGNELAVTGHSDCMQILQSGKQIYYNNWIESKYAGENGAVSGLNGQNNLGNDTTLFYNNVIIIRGFVYSLFMDRSPTGHTWLLYNNTIIKEYDDTPSGVIQTVHPQTFAKNNIIYSTNSKYPLVEFQNPLSPGNRNFDYNLYYHPYYPYITGGYTLSAWKALGGDPKSKEGDPLFKNFIRTDKIDLTLQSNSPCRDAGTASIKSFIESWGLPWTDYAGTPRSETTPSIGAYEYVP